MPSTSRSYFYPSVASSVLLSEFIGKPDWLDLWKVRGSWTVSKQDLGVYDTNVNYNVNQGAWEDYNTATYPTTIKGGTKLDDEQLEKIGANTSITHEDFMVGSEKLNIEAHTFDGEKIMILKDGEWAFEI